MHQRPDDSTSEFSADWIQLIADNLPISISYIDSQERYRYCNRTYETFFRRSKEKVIGRTVREVAGEKDYRDLKEKIDLALSGETAQFEISFLLPDGTPRAVSSSYTPHIDDHGKVLGYFALTQDTTRQQQEAEARLASEKRFMDFAAAAADRFWETDKDHVYTFMSEPTEGLSIPTEAIIGKKPWDIISKHSDAETNERITALFNKKQAFKNVRFALNPREGSTRHVVLSAIPVLDEGGKFAGYRGITIDETDTVEAREKAARVERKFLEAMEHMGGGYTLWGPDGTLEGWNKAYAQFEWEDDHILVRGVSFAEFIRDVGRVRLSDWAPEDREAWAAERIAEFESKEPGDDLYRTKTGAWLKIVRHPLEDGSVVQFVTDITQQKEQEQEIRASEERFRDFTAAAADRFWETDENHRHIYMSPPTDGLPMPSDTIVGKTAWDIETRDIDAETRIRLMALFGSHEPFQGERFHWKSVTGNEIDVVMSGVPVFDRKGRFKGYRGVTINETDVVRAREKAARVERKFMEAMEHMGAGYTLWSPDGYLEGWNEAYSNAREDFRDSLAVGMDYRAYLSNIARSELPDASESTRKKWMAERLDDLESQQQSQREIKLPDGRWLKVWKQKLADGSTVVFQADISDQKRREEELRLSEEMFRQIFEATGNGMAVLSVDGNLRRVNQAFADITGYAKEELIGRNLLDITHPDDREMTLEGRNSESIQSGKEMLAMEKRYVRKDGSIVWVLVTGTAVLDSDGNPQFRVGHVQDITQRRAAEEALRESEERFRLIVEALDWISDGIEIIEPDGRLLYCNTRNTEFYPSTADIAVPGTPLKDLVRAIADSGLIGNAVKDKEAWIAARMDSFMGGDSEPRESRLTNGRWLMVRNFRTDDGSVITVRTDITERKTTEQSLHQSQHRLQAITETLHEGVVVIDERGWIAFSNRSANKMLGVGTDGSVLGEPVDDVFRIAEDGQPMNFVDGPIRRVIADDAPLSNEDAVFALPDGQSLLVDFACAPLRDKGKSKSCVISFRDIRERKEAQKEVFQSMKLASVGELAAGIAHEINTPVQYIGDNLRFIRESVTEIQGVVDAYKKVATAAAETHALDAQVMELDKVIKDVDLGYLMEELPSATEQSLNGVETISRIVLAMKEFAHPGQRQKALTDINKAVENTLTVSRNEWKHYADVETDLADNLVAIPCLAGEINQVLLNLIVNATHAIHDRHGQEKGLIRISTRRDDDHVEIRISDNGTGIPKHVQDKVFDQFFTTKEVGRGTGQGLSVSHDVIVNKHGGTITFETEQDKGTTFIIRLPVNADSRKSEAA